MQKRIIETGRNAAYQSVNTAMISTYWKLGRRIVEEQRGQTSKITHQDVGQMDMYIRMYDELKRGEGDNPTLGIVLCSETDEDIARYSILHGNEQLL